MTNIKDKPGGRPAKKRIEKQQRVVSTKLTELQYYAIRKRAGESGLRVSEYVRQAVVSAEVIPRLNRQDADTIRKLAAIEKRREERKQAEEGTESGRPQGTDLVQISEAAKAALKNNKPVEAAEPIDSEPVTYTPAGEIAAAPVEAEPTVSFTA